MKRILIVLAGILFLVVAIFGAMLWFIRVPAIEADGANRVASLRQWFDERHTHQARQFNGAALIVAEGETLLRDVWGKDGDGRPLDSESRFRLASVSKSFTAAAILRLADTGRLELDTPIRDQLPDCDIGATPAEVLRHRSGLPDSYMERADPETVLTIAAAYEGICTTGGEASQPGEFAYNNSGYVLLAGMVEKISGKSFEAFLGEEVLAPLGMENTRVWNLVSEDKFADRATGFDLDGKVVPTNLDGVAGDGAVFSTLDDMRNWTRFWRDDRLISTALKDRATGRNLGDGYHFGLIRDGDRVWHNGSWLGAATYFGFVDRDEPETIVVILDNGASIFVDEMADAIWLWLGKSPDG